MVGQNLVAPLPLVAFGALAYVRWLRVLLSGSVAAVSMETGAAGTWVCDKLQRQKQKIKESWSAQTAAAAGAGVVGEPLQAP